VLFEPGPVLAGSVRAPEDLAALVIPPLLDLDREHCLLAALDTKHRLLALRTVSVGTVDHTFMAPREVFRDALLLGAAAVAVAHNHPSGDPEPSADDFAVTRRLARAGELLGVPLLDHLVVGRGHWRSLARLGGLPSLDRQA
jgi:DNA repair protein RadC